jgi:integrase
MRISEYFESIYRVKKLWGKSENTVRLYRLSVRSFGKTLGRDADLADLTNENVMLHMQRVLSNGRSKATANKDREQLLVLWRHAFRAGLIKTWPDVPKCVEAQRTPEAWLIDDLEALLESARSQPGQIGTAPAGLFWEALIRICLDTAERIGAVMGLKWDDVERGWVMVRAELRKGSRRDKRYQLSRETIALLAELRKFNGRHATIFHWPHHWTYLWARYGKVVKGAGLPSGRKCKLHRLRKTTASIAHASGLNAQELLDHQHRRTTNAYLDPRFTRDEQASDVVQSYLQHRLNVHR